MIKDRDTTGLLLIKKAKEVVKYVIMVKEVFGKTI